MAHIPQFVNGIVVSAKEMLDHLLADFKIRNSDKRMTHRQAILDRYTGKDIIGPIDQYFSDNVKTLVLVAAHNIVKKIVNREAQVYKEMPTVKFPSENGNDETELPEEYNQVKRWMTFKKAERRTKLLGTGLIQSFWNAAGELDWRYIHRYRVFTGDDPLAPIAIAYPLTQHIADDTHQARNKTDSQLWAFWSAEKHFLFNPDNGKKTKPTEKNTKHINPYGILPFRSVHPDYQDGEYWVESPQEDTVNVMDALNKGVTEGRLGIRFAMGQPVISGETDVDFLNLGVDLLLKVPEGANYKHEALNANFTGLIDMLKFDLATVLASHGLSAEFSQEGSSPTSGFSLIIRNMPLIEERQSDLGLWRWYDKDVYAIEQRIWEVETKSKLPDGRHVDYVEPKFPKTVDERIKSEEHDLSLGLTNVATLARKRDPDGFKTEEDALKFIEDNKKINAEAGFRGKGEPAPVANLLTGD